MESEPKTPLGYCPNCEYPMDPGRCPECGEEVPPERLSDRPYSERRRRRRRRIVLCFVLLVLAVAAWKTVRSINWYSSYSTGQLLAIQGDGLSGSSQELVRRYAAGQLTQAETCRLFQQALRVGFPKPEPDPFPARQAILVYCPCGVDLMDHAFAPRMHQVEAIFEGTLDGYPLPLRRTVRSQSLWIFPYECRMTIEAPQELLTPGAHQLTLKVSVSLYDMSGASSLVALQPLNTWTFMRSSSIELVDRPASDYVTAVQTEAVARQVEAAMVVPEEAVGGPHPRLSIVSNGAPISITGSVWVRAAGQADFTRVGDLVFQSYGPSRSIFGMEQVPGIEGATHIDIRIVPEAGLALQCWNEKVYYGRVIERSNVPLKPEGPTTRGATPED